MTMYRIYAFEISKQFKNLHINRIKILDTFPTISFRYKYEHDQK